jgi:hypothetical protein
MYLPLALCTDVSTTDLLLVLKFGCFADCIVQSTGFVAMQLEGVCPMQLQGSRYKVTQLLLPWLDLVGWGMCPNAM